MSQKLLQIKKQLTFADIAPYWFDKLTDGKRYVLEKVQLTMDNCKYCVVGEAHGFKELGLCYKYMTDYGCEECNGFSYGGTEHYLSGTMPHDNFCDIPRGLTPEQINNHPTVQAFVEHWNEKHV